MEQGSHAGRGRRPKAGVRLARPEWILLLCLLLAAPFLLTCWVHGDGIGYVAYLRSAVVDRDLDLADEFAHLSTHMRADAWGLPAALLSRSAHQPGVDPTFHTPQPDPVTGRVPSAFSVGPPLAWAPGYLVAHGLTLLFGGAGGPADGYGGLYYLAIALGSLLFGAAGLVLAYRLAGAVAPPGESLAAVLALAGASPLLYYLYLAPSYSHALTVLTSGAFFLYWWRTRHADRAATWFRWGLLAGVLFLARWNDAALALPVFGAEALRLLRGDGARRGSAPALRLAACAAAAGLGFLLAASPQLGVWQYLHGRPWVRYPVDYLGFSAAGLWGTLWSARHGLFVWTPIALPSVAGLFLLWRRDRELAAVSLLAVLLLAVSNATARDWWGGASFGARRMLSATPLLALGLAACLDQVRRALTRRAPAAAGLAAPLALSAFVLWNVLLLAQYSLGMISHTGPVSLGAIAANQPAVVARLVRLAGDVLR